MTASHKAASDPLAPLQAQEQQAIQQGDPDAVIAACTQLNAAALQDFGQLRLRQHQPEEAVALLQQSLAIQDSAAVRHDLQTAQSASATFATTTSSTGGQRQDDSASSPAGHQHVSQPAAADQREEELRRILAESYNDLGTAQARQQNYQAALGSFSEAAHWQPPTPILLKNLGVAAFRVEDYRRAADALGAYLKTAEDGRLRLMLAMANFSMGNFADAATNFGQASQQAMADPRAAYSWAFSLARTGQQQHANEIAKQLAGSDLPPDAMYLVCHVFMDTEAYEQSLSCLRRLAVVDPTMKLVHYGEGESLIRLDRPAEAVPELRAELKLSPDDPNVESSLAFALLQTSQKAEARTLLEHAIATDPTHARAQYQLGKLLLDQGDAAAAVPHLEISEQTDPSPDYVHYQLGTAYRKLGRSEDAEREFHTYRAIKDKARAAATVPGH